MTLPRLFLVCALGLLFAPRASAEIHHNPGSPTPLPHDKYIHVVSEADSPVQQVYIKSKDGLYIAAALRKPKGTGVFPAMIIFHGAPGGRGMEQLVGWSRGDHGGPVWERFLQEGYVVIVADYRGGNMTLTSAPASNGMITSIDDGLAVIEYVKSLPYVDTTRINLYGVSLGGNLVMNLVSRVPVHAAILGAPATIWFLGVTMPPTAPTSGPDRFKDAKIDPELTRTNIEPIKTPILILVGTADSLLPVATLLHDALAAQSKPVQMEVYEHGYHDFCLGPQGQKRPDLPQGEALLDSALDALEKSVRFAKDAVVSGAPGAPPPAAAAQAEAVSAAPAATAPAATARAAAAGPAAHDDWALVWSDEFNTPGRPDPGNWTYEAGFVRNHELQWYQPANARVENGMLIIEAKRERLRNPRYRAQAAASDWKIARESSDYTSASLNTRGLHAWQYGRFEMRARIDARLGLWPAFWTLGATGHWPAGGEIDIMEYYRGMLLANVASVRDAQGTPAWHTVKKPLETFGDAHWSERFHVWRMDWDDQTIKLYVDDLLMNSVDLATTTNGDGSGVNPFHQPQYLLLNLAIGGDAGGDPADTMFPARFEVDYVRVYQRH